MLPVLALLVAVVTGGCQTGSPGATATSSESTTAAEATTPVEVDLVGGVLGAHDEKPVDLASQLEYFQGGGSPCEDGTGPWNELVVRPYPVAREHERLETPDSWPICVMGIDSTQDLSIEIQDPDGQVIDRLEVPAAGEPDHYSLGYIFGFSRLAGDPLGDYVIRAVQPQASSQATIEVVAAKDPILVPLHVDESGEFDLSADAQSGSNRLGDTLGFAFGGLPPNTQTQIHVYGRPTDGTSVVTAIDYRTSIMVTSDADGGGTLKVTTSVEDEEGFYGFALEGAGGRYVPINLARE
ncbi:hypothetical protein Kisp02_73100 [Kineosporia sp. NBRC 101731]|nr:hypothetical protein Kisp02_73100 [Kineosporia sp. NBRC 101731]